jgi:hypothetical protein
MSFSSGCRPRHRKRLILRRPAERRGVALSVGWRGCVEQKVKLSHVNEDLSYQVTDADTGFQKIVKGKKLIKKGVSVAFGGDRLSALLFIEPVK